LRADAPDAPPARSFADFSLASRPLIAGLMALALLPNLTVAAYLWLPAIERNAPQPSAPVEPASLADAVPVADSQPAQIRPVVSAPVALEASASGDVDLPIALDGTDGVPVRSVIAVSGLPLGATLSSGRPYGASGWNLKSDEIGDLKLHLPDNAQGETKLAIELVAPHGEIISSTEVVLRVSADPELAPSPEVAAMAAPSAASPKPKVAPVPVNAAIPEPVRVEPEAKPVIANTAFVENEDVAPSPAHAPKPMALAAADPASDDADAGTITPAMYVNLRERPTSSAPVLGIVAKGTKLTALDRKRGWVQVTDPQSSKTGWVYSGNLEGASRKIRRASNPQESSESFWSRVGRALTGSPPADTGTDSSR
jgi:hypothetical protein